MIKLKDKKGIGIELITIVIVAFILILFFAGWIYGMNLVNNQLQDIQGDGTEGTNISSISGKSFGYYNLGVKNGLPLISTVLLFSFIIATFIIGFYSQKNVLWVVVYILISVLVVVFSVYIENTYEDLVTQGLFEGGLTNFTVLNFVMANLTAWIIAVAAIGIIIMLSGVIISNRSEGL